MPSAQTGAAVEVATSIDASPETIFEFLVDPDKMMLWMGRDVELEPRPGGLFRCDINGRNIARGTFVEVDRPRRVVFTFGWEGGEGSVGPGESAVEITLEPDGDSTTVRLVHRDLPDEGSREGHGKGWRHYAERLSIAASGGDPGEDAMGTPEGADAAIVDLARRREGNTDDKFSPVVRGCGCRP